MGAFCTLDDNNNKSRKGKITKDQEGYRDVTGSWEHCGWR